MGQLWLCHAACVALGHYPASLAPHVQVDVQDVLLSAQLLTTALQVDNRVAEVAVDAIVATREDAEWIQEAMVGLGLDLGLPLSAHVPPPQTICRRCVTRFRLFVCFVLFFVGLVGGPRLSPVLCVLQWACGLAHVQRGGCVVWALCDTTTLSLWGLFGHAAPRIKFEVRCGTWCTTTLMTTRAWMPSTRFKRCCKTHECLPLRRTSCCTRPVGCPALCGA